MSDFILTRNGTTVAIVTYPITPLGVGAVVSSPLPSPPLPKPYQY